MDTISKVKRPPNCLGESFAFRKVRYVTEPGGLQDFLEWTCHGCKTRVTIRVDELVSIEPNEVTAGLVVS